MPTRKQKRFRVDDVVADQLALVNLSGPMSDPNLDELHETIDILIMAGANKFIIGLDEVDSLDTAGVKHLIRVRDHIYSQGGRLAIYGMNDRVANYLRVTQLRTLLVDGNGLARAMVKLAFPEPTPSHP